MSKLSYTIPAMAMLAMVVAGCFKEPIPAYKTVPADHRIYLSDKALEHFPQVNPKADYLNLDRNKLKDITGAEKLVYLKWLRLNNNALSSLPDISALKNLRRIYLRGNLFAEVPPGLNNLPSLTDVELSKNPIREVPEWFVKKTGLKNVSLNGTLISKLPDDLSGWKSLQSLQLGDTPICNNPAEMARIREQLKDVAIIF